MRSGCVILIFSPALFLDVSAGPFTSSSIMDSHALQVFTLENTRLLESPENISFAH